VDVCDLLKRKAEAQISVRVNFYAEKKRLVVCYHITKISGWQAGKQKEGRKQHVVKQGLNDSIFL